MRGRVLSPDEKTWSVRWDESNDFRVIRNGLGQEVLREDQETTRFTFTQRKGLGNGLEAWLELPVENRGGGFMDPLINWWHEHVLRSYHPGRENSPLGQSVIRYAEADYSGDQFGIGDVSVGLRKTLGRRWTAEAALKLPTGDSGRLLGSGAADLGIALNYTVPLGTKWTAYGQAGAIWQGKGRIANARSLAHEENIAVIWHPNNRDAWVLQWNSDSAAIQTGLAESDSTHRILTAGYERQLTRNRRLDLYFSENNDFLREVTGIGPDFSIGAMLTLRF